MGLVEINAFLEAVAKRKAIPNLVGNRTRSSSPCPSAVSTE
jgi:hypothetical protein